MGQEIRGLGWEKVDETVEGIYLTNYQMDFPQDNTGAVLLSHPAASSQASQQAKAAGSRQRQLTHISNYNASPVFLL